LWETCDGWDEAVRPTGVVMRQPVPVNDINRFSLDFDTDLQVSLTQMNRGDCAGRKGFTLVELLVVMAILIVLAALVFVVFRNVRTTGDMATSMNRIRAYGLANSSYASDQNGRYVSNAKWDDESRFQGSWDKYPDFLSYIVGNAAYQDGDPATGEIADSLPEDLLDPVAYRSKKNRWDKVAASYGYVIEGVDPSGWAKKGMDKHRTVFSVQFPARSAAFMTCKDWNAKYTGRFLWKDNPTEGKLPTGDIAYRYNDKCLVVFFDGHTETMTMADMERIDEELGGRDSVFWDADGPWK
jgi:prepilin-type N-terminal cleavage/methylation domain-containing protein